MTHDLIITTFAVETAPEPGITLGIAHRIRFSHLHDLDRFARATDLDREVLRLVQSHLFDTALITVDRLYWDYVPSPEKPELDTVLKRGREHPVSLHEYGLGAADGLVLRNLMRHAITASRYATLQVTSES